jgi:branched-chain amino acid transport system substrate-binding protein
VNNAIAGNKPLLDSLVGTTFQTVVGPITFGENHELRDNPYRLLEWRGNGFLPPHAPAD